MHRLLTVILLATVALGTTTSAATPASSMPASTTPTRVTLIGDSIATAIAYDPTARRILARGIDLDLQVAPCRRLVGDSCPYEGKQPPSLIELLPTLRVGATVVVATGYNDYENMFASTVETTLTALRNAGVENVLWLTLRAERQSYLHMNDLLGEASKGHPELTLVDWNLYSRSHPDWFQPDGLHLLGGGAIAMATLVHEQLNDLGLVAAPTPSALVIATQRLPAGHVGRRYTTRLITAGGSAPIRWVRAKGVLPTGLTLRRNGVLSGIPRAAGRRFVLLGATDVRSRSVARRFAITITP